MDALIQSAIDSDLISPAEHAPLLRDADRITRQAGVNLRFLFTPLLPTCSEEELDYVRALRRLPADNVYGLAYVGEGVLKGLNGRSGVADRMQAIAGVCLRNYVSVKYRVKDRLIADLREGDAPEDHVLMIPDFFIQGATDFGRAQLLGMLYARQSAGKQTILYVSDLNAMGVTYGKELKAHVDSYFVKITE